MELSLEEIEAECEKMLNIIAAAVGAVVAIVVCILLVALAFQYKWTIKKHFYLLKYRFYIQFSVGGKPEKSGKGNHIWDRLL